VDDAFAAKVHKLGNDSMEVFTNLNRLHSSHIRILDIKHQFEDYNYRSPFQFGGRTVDRVTLLNVTVRVVSASGKEASGFGTMPLGNLWSFPSPAVSYDESLEAMTRLAARLESLLSDYPNYSHPIDIHWESESAYLHEANRVSSEMNLPEPLPALCTLVTASPFDAAIHDAFGKANSINCYSGYGPAFMDHDLSYYLGPEFRGEYLDKYLSITPKPFVFLYHSVGALDPISDLDLHSRIGDGLPETLADWIEKEAITHFKIKLNGADLKADIERVVSIERTVVEAQARRGVNEWKYCCDFNEHCEDVDYLLAFLDALKRQSPAFLRRLQYIEQPTERDLKAHMENDMRKAAAIVPVVIDESLINLESFYLSRRLGYSGVALKVCKGQSNALLMAAAAQKVQSFLCVQDLTCPGASLVHSVGLAAHIPGVSTIEANSRQYVPSANQPWVDKFPGIFKVSQGMFETGSLKGLGLGVVGNR
jgi:L-alanine-DL-glutamate epimerase-like enolase superfamily enzyme